MDSVPTQHHPSPEERDERVKVDVDPEQFIAGVLAVDPDDDADEESDPEG